MRLHTKHGVPSGAAATRPAPPLRRSFDSIRGGSIMATKRVQITAGAVTPPPPPPPPPNAVKGLVFFEHGLPATGLTVRAYSRGFGGVDVKLGEAKTDDQ